jgi:hypothetical protein
MSFETLRFSRRRAVSTSLFLVALLVVCPTLGADDFATELNTVLKAELEKEFGPLTDQIMFDEKQIYGRVIAIDYQLPEGGRLDDTWGDKVVAALERLGVTAEYDGGEVRAEQQTIAGREAASIQFTTARPQDEPDSIALSAMFM